MKNIFVLLLFLAQAAFAAPRDIEMDRLIDNRTKAVLATSTEVGYLTGLTANIQAQLNAVTGGGGGGSGITSLNGLTSLTQTFLVGVTGVDFNVDSSGSQHRFNLPTASASNRGALSSADWSAFNGKQDALGFIPVNKAGDSMTGPLSTPMLTTGGVVSFSGVTVLNTATGLLRAENWSNSLNFFNRTLSDGITGTMLSWADGGITITGTTAGYATITDGLNHLASSPVTAIELGYLAGATSTIQGQLNANAAAVSSLQGVTGNFVLRTGDTMTGGFGAQALRLPFSSAPSILFGDDTDSGLYQTSDGDLFFDANGFPRFHISQNYSEFLGPVTVSGNLDIGGSISAANYPPVGNANAVAYFDATGALASLPGWDRRVETGGLTNSIVIDDVDLPGGLAVSEEQLNVNATGISTNVNAVHRTQVMRLTGSGTFGGFLSSSDMRYEQTGDVYHDQDHTFHNDYIQLGQDGVTVSGRSGNQRWLQAGFDVYAGHTALGFEGIRFSGTVHPGASFGGYRGIGFFPNFDEGINSYVPFQSFPTFSGSNQYAQHFEAKHEFRAGSYTGNAVGINVYDAVLSGATVNGMAGFQYTPNINAGGHVLGGFQGFNIAPHADAGAFVNSFAPTINPTGDFTAATYFQGLNINISGVTVSGGVDAPALRLDGNAVRLDGSPGFALDAQGRVNMNYSGVAASIGFIAGNNIGGQTYIKAGQPVTSTLIFGTNMSGSLIASDNMGPDGTGLGIGYTSFNSSGQLIVETGVTVDSINAQLSGFSAAADPSYTDGGHVLHAYGLRGLGIIPQGGNPIVHEYSQFAFESFGCSLVLGDCYGLDIKDPTSKNRVATSIQLQGLTANTVAVLDASKTLASSAVTDTELGYLSGVTSSIQSQLANSQRRSSMAVSSDSVLSDLVVDLLVNADSSGGGFSVTLGDAVVSDGLCVNVKNVGNPLQGVTVTPPAGQQLEGVTTGYVLSTPNESAKFCPNTGNWFIY